MRARSAGAVALTVLSWVLRLCGIALTVIVAALCFSGAAAKLGIVDVVVDLSRALPQAIAGYGVIATPFGGVFRFDFALVAVGCFVLDAVCARLARALRR